MKNMLLSFLLILPFGLFSQAFVHETVLQSMNRGQSIQVLVTLHEQLDASGLSKDFRNQSVPVKDRPRIVLTQLEEICRESQSSLIADLTASGFSFQIIHQLRIVNMVVLHTHPETIEFLAGHEAVRSIVPDQSPFKLIEPVDYIETGTRAENSSEIGLTVIGANEMWSLGYTGRGRLAYSVDTGIWPNHPAIKRQWKGHRYPLAECWLPWDRETPGDKANSHGSHTTGTILGLDTLTNDTIGVAFNAYFIATDPVVSNAADIRPLSDYIIAYEWCLNPDGDINTSDDVPDAINNSWGRQPGDDATYCDEDMTQMYIVLEAAGIANLSSAGNSGPEPQTLTVPHNISVNEVNGFTVGSINGNNPALPISEFSSRGPGQCGGDGSILIKPEVVAPGQSVRSCVGQNGYASLSGTSMACPHAVGAVLLLKEAFPYLPGHELLEALYYSAIDLGIPGEDNTYGMGVINVFAAYNYLIDLGYTPDPPSNSPYDLVVTEILSPVNGATCSSTFTPQIVVKNAGLEPIGGFNINFGMVSGASMVADWDDTLLPGESTTIQLPLFNTAQTGLAEFYFRVEPYEDFEEIDILNNQLISRVTIKAQVDVPFTETFESTSINSGLWHLHNPDFSKTWELFPTAGLPDSEQSIRVNLYDYSPRASQQDDLIGPRVGMPGSGNLYLAFDLAYKVRNGPEILYDSLEVWIANNCALDNPTLIYATGGQEMNTHNMTTQNFVPDSSNQWRHEIIDLSEFAAEEIIIPFFRTINRKGDNVYIDNVAIYQDGNPLGIEEGFLSAAVLFPNPSRDNVNIQWPENAPQLGITLYDSVGRIVWQQEVMNTSLVTFSSAGLNRGIYFVRLESGTQSQVLRFIRQ